MKVYLDSSILRGMPGSARPREPYVWISSALVGLELLERALESEKEFLLRRPAINRLLSGAIDVEWILWDTVVGRAFGAFRTTLPKIDEKGAAVRMAAEVFKRSESIDAFRRALDEEGLTERLSALIAAMRRYTAEPRRIAGEAQQIIYEAFEKPARTKRLRMSERGASAFAGRWMRPRSLRVGESSRAGFWQRP